MKLTLVIVFISVLQVSAAVFSQTNINLDIQNKSVSEVLKTIEQQSPIRFFYSDDLLVMKELIDVKAENKSIKMVLDEIFSKTPLTYRTYDNNLIVIVPRLLFQNQKVSGIVTDANTGEPLPGVNIMVKGTKQGVISDANGKFSLEMEDTNATLVFSYIGYLSEEVFATVGSQMDIKLVQDVKELEEVVVVGYGTQKKSDLIGSVSMVSGKNLEKTAAVDPLQAFQGKSAGVSIVSSSGQPGDGYNVQIRGIQSVNAGTNPTYVIDGVISDNISNINTNDIESISVLKDGASAAIYGTRAANGIILITTKRGTKNETPVITFHTYLGIHTPSNRRLRLLNSDQWLQLDNESYTNDGSSRPYNVTDLEIYRDANGEYMSTDWMDVIMQTGNIKYYDLSVAGGSEKSNYFTSVNYLDQKGVILKQTAKKINLRFNSDHKINKFIEFGNTLNLYSSSNSGLPNFNGTNFSYSPNPYLQAVRKSPLSRAWEEDGGYGINLNQNIEYSWLAPQAIANEYKRRSKTFGTLGNLYLKLNLVKGLTFTPRIGINYDYYQDAFFTPIIRVENSETITINTIEKASSNVFHWQMDYMLNYENSFNGNHNLAAMLIYSQEEQTYETLGGSRAGTPNNELQYLSSGDPGSATNYNGYTDWSFVSYIGRVNYNYREKYLFQATIRRDGSSRFTQENRWGVFPSISAGWKLSKERFFESLTPVVNDLKLRVSYGTLGNADIGNYPTYSELAEKIYVLNNSKAGGYTLESAVNKKIKWEKTRKYNVGFDAAFLDSRIYLTADYFISKTTDLLFQKPLPLSSGKDQWDLPYTNTGKIQNKGIELEFGVREKRGNFSYDISTNFSYVRNEVINLAGLDEIINTDNNTITSVGSSIYSYYGYKTNGIIQTQADLDSYKASLYNTDEADITATLGDVWRTDVNGYDENWKLTGKPDGKIDGADRTVIGRRYPNFSYGLTANASYKSFSLQVQIQGVQGYDLPITGISLNYFQGNPMNMNNVVLDRWHETANPGGTLPRLTRTDPAGNISDFSDIWLSNASYLRINNVSLSWDLPENVCKLFVLDALKLYCSVQNLFTFTNFKGVEPDVTLGNSYLGGIAADKIPQSRTWIMGLKLSF